MGKWKWNFLGFNNAEIKIGDLRFIVYNQRTLKNGKTKYYLWGYLFGEGKTQATTITQFAANSVEDAIKFAEEYIEQHFFAPINDEKYKNS